MCCAAQARRRCHACERYYAAPHFGGWSLLARLAAGLLLDHPTTLSGRAGYNCGAYRWPQPWPQLRTRSELTCKARRDARCTARARLGLFTVGFSSVLQTASAIPKRGSPSRAPLARKFRILCWDADADVARTVADHTQHKINPRRRRPRGAPGARRRRRPSSRRRRGRRGPGKRACARSALQLPRAPPRYLEPTRGRPS